MTTPENPMTGDLDAIHAAYAEAIGSGCPADYEACRALPYAGARSPYQCWRGPGHDSPHRDPYGGAWTDAEAAQS
jgi:hypothetical protein